MEGKKLVIFDQDGTLVDTSSSSIKCIIELGKYLKKEIPSEITIKNSLSGPFSHNIKRLYDLEDEEVLPAIYAFVKIYDSVEAYYDFQEYPGMCDVIRDLSSKYMLSVATMMLGDFSVKTLGSLDVDGCFLTIQGTNLTEPLSKQDIINRCLSIADCTPEESVMIGDSVDDLVSARNAGIDFIGITYGYQLTPEDCEKYGVPYVSKPSDLLNIL